MTRYQFKINMTQWSLKTNQFQNFQTGSPLNQPLRVTAILCNSFLQPIISIHLSRHLCVLQAKKLNSLKKMLQKFTMNIYAKIKYLCFFFLSVCSGSQCQARTGDISLVL